MVQEATQTAESSTLEMITLIEGLRYIDAIPTDISVDKKAEAVKLLDRYRKTHPVVDNAARGEFSFTNAVEQFNDVYGGLRLLLPRFKNRAYDKKFEELNLGTIFYSLNYERPGASSSSLASLMVDKINNPLGFAAVTFFAGYFVCSIGPNLNKPHDLITHSLIALAGAAIGAMIGTVPKQYTITSALNDAKYLDSKIKEMYHPEK